VATKPGVYLRYVADLLVPTKTKLARIGIAIAAATKALTRGTCSDCCGPSPLTFDAQRMDAMGREGVEEQPLGW
jgi:hypothetical protein